MDPNRNPIQTPHLTLLTLTHIHTHTHIYIYILLIIFLFTNMTPCLKTDSGHQSIYEHELSSLAISSPNYTTRLRCHTNMSATFRFLPGFVESHQLVSSCSGRQHQYRHYRRHHHRYFLSFPQYKFKISPDSGKTQHRHIFHSLSFSLTAGPQPDADSNCEQNNKKNHHDAHPDWHDDVATQHNLDHEQQVEPAINHTNHNQTQEKSHASDIAQPPTETNLSSTSSTTTNHVSTDDSQLVKSDEYVLDPLRARTLQVRLMQKFALKHIQRSNLILQEVHQLQQAEQQQFNSVQHLQSDPLNTTLYHQHQHQDSYNYHQPLFLHRKKSLAQVLRTVLHRLTVVENAIVQLDEHHASMNDIYQDIMDKKSAIQSCLDQFYKEEKSDKAKLKKYPSLQGISAILFADHVYQLKRATSEFQENFKCSINSILDKPPSVEWNKLSQIIGNNLDDVSNTWKRLNGFQPCSSNDPQSLSQVNQHAHHRQDTRNTRLSTGIQILQAQVAVLQKKLELTLIDKNKAIDTKITHNHYKHNTTLFNAGKSRFIEERILDLQRLLALKLTILDLEAIYIHLTKHLDDVDDDLVDELVLFQDFAHLDAHASEFLSLVSSNRTYLIQDEELRAFSSSVEDLKVRAGIHVQNKPNNSALVKIEVKNGLLNFVSSLKTHILFVLQGIVIFLSDMWTTSKLLQRASLQRKVLNSREVSFLRKSCRDLFCASLCLLVVQSSLYSIWKVLGFLYILKFYPHLFPSAFSEQRQRSTAAHQKFRKSLEQGPNENRHIFDKNLPAWNV